MSVLSLFIFQVLLTMAISLVLIVLLKPLLAQVLVESCGTAQRSAFWIMFTSLMLVISPLLIVIYFAQVDSSEPVNIALSLKNTLFQCLLGDFIALSAIARVIWRSFIESVDIRQGQQLQGSKAHD